MTRGHEAQGGLAIFGVLWPCPTTRGRPPEWSKLKSVFQQMNDVTKSFVAGVSTGLVWVIVLVVFLYAIHVARIKQATSP